MADVQFILGRSGTGKTHWCIESVCAALAAGGDEPLILLVPEQATYQAERAILSHPNIFGFSRLRILSFNRLQFWLDSVSGKPEISRTGKAMLLGKLLGELADNLSLYQGSQQRAGLADKLAGLMGELQRANCLPQQISALAKKLAAATGQEIAAAKWADIALLFERYAGYFQSAECGFVNPDVRLRQAVAKTAAADFLRGATVWVDGFSGFSIQERDLLIELLKVAQAGHIALCLDPAAIDLANTDTEKLDPFSLFQATEQTYTDLLRIFKGCQFNCQEPVRLETAHRFADAAPLAHLEANTLDMKPARTPAGEHLRIAACSNVRAEAVYAAQTIRTLVKDNGMRFRDIAVVVPDMDGYGHYLESAFAQYGLPYFLDRPRNMKNHPLTALIGSALQAIGGHFALGDVLSFLKSDFGKINPQELAQLENYARAYDLQGTEWRQTSPWDFAPEKDKKEFDEKRLDVLRKQALKPLLTLEQAMKAEPEITAEAFTQAVWQMLEAVDVPATLAAWAADDASDQRFGHRQLYGKLVDLADEMGVIFTGQALPAASWAAILTDAISSLTIKLIPPTLDQVLIGAIERSRHPDVKAIFLMGATQKQFPVPLSQDNLLTEQEYQLVAVGEMELANPYQQQLAGRQYLAYIALTRASHRLYLTYPVLDEKGAGVVPWSGIEPLTAMFADLQPEHPQAVGADETAIQTPQDFSQWLAAQTGKDRLCDDAAAELAAALLEKSGQSDAETLKTAAARVQTALAYDNAATLEAPTAATLFETPMHSSVSRLGTFAACPFQYFAKYTLKLDKRKTLTFEPMDIGTFYHAVLEKLFNAMAEKGLAWATIEDATRETLCGETIEAILKEDTHIANFMRRNKHHAYIIAAAGRTITDFTGQLSELARAGSFQQTAAEKKFEFTIKRGQEPFIEFNGVIDRLDTAHIDGQDVGLVYDFKRTDRRANFTGMLYGLDLQLPVYLLAIRQGRGSQSLVSAGAFYVPIEMGAASAPLSRLGQAGGGFRNKAKGLFNGDFAGMLDTDAGNGWNAYYNFYQGKDGPLGNYKNSGALKPEDFASLLDYTERIVVKLAAEMAGGQIGATPYRLGKKSPCAWCDYRSLCRFDWQINDYNILETCDKEQALEKMKEKIT